MKVVELMKAKGKFDKNELQKFGINLDGKSSEKMFNSAQSMDCSQRDYNNGTPDLGQNKKMEEISIQGEVNNELYMTQPKIDMKKGSLPLVMGTP